MTTTKRSVDPSSAIYRRAVSRMLEPTRAWIDYTNARKQAGFAEKEVVTQLETTARPVDITAVPQSSVVRLPSIVKRTPGPTVANMNNAVPRRRLRRLAAGFGNVNMTYRDVGLSSFDYAYEELVDEDDS